MRLKLIFCALIVSQYIIHCMDQNSELQKMSDEQSNNSGGAAAMDVDYQSNAGTKRTAEEDKRAAKRQKVEDANDGRAQAAIVREYTEAQKEKLAILKYDLEHNTHGGKHRDHQNWQLYKRLVIQGLEEGLHPDDMHVSQLWNPFNCALMHDDAPFLQLLFDHGATMPRKSNRPILFSARSIAVAQILMAHGASIFEKSESPAGDTLLFCRSFVPASMIMFYVQRGLDVDSADIHQCTPLTDSIERFIWAVDIENSSLWCIEYLKDQLLRTSILISLGADINHPCLCDKKAAQLIQLQFERDRTNKQRAALVVLKETIDNALQQRMQAIHDATGLPRAVTRIVGEFISPDYILEVSDQSQNRSAQTQTNLENQTSITASAMEISSLPLS